MWYLVWKQLIELISTNSNYSFVINLFPFHFETLLKHLMYAIFYFKKKKEEEAILMLKMIKCVKQPSPFELMVWNSIVGLAKW